MMKTLTQRIDELFDDAHARRISRESEKRRQDQVSGKLGTSGKNRQLPILASEADDEEEEQETKQAAGKKSSPDDGGENDDDQLAIKKLLNVSDDDKMPEYDDVVASLNSIRAGRSLKDQDINDSFEKYYDDLSSAEKIAMYKYLTGISEILTGKVSPEDAVEPSDEKVAKVDTSVKGAPEGGGEKKKEAPAPVKKKQLAKPSQNDDKEEDDSSPVPIKVK